MAWNVAVSLQPSENWAVYDAISNGGQRLSFTDKKIFWFQFMQKKKITLFLTHIKSSREYILYLNACYDSASRSIFIWIIISHSQKTCEFWSQWAEDKISTDSRSQYKASIKHDLDARTRNSKPVFPPESHSAEHSKRTKSKQILVH